MRKLLAVLTVGLVGLLFSPDALRSQTAGRVEDKLVGTWERIAPELPEGYRQIKHVTPTHFTWVAYHRGKMTPVGLAGGTWSLQGDTYQERIEFAGEQHPFLRGKEYTFTIKREGDQWFLKGIPGTEIEVDEVWKRAGSSSQ